MTPPSSTPVSAVGRPSGLLVIFLLWSVPIAAALVAEAPLGATDSRTLVAALLGPVAMRYLGYCPMPLVVYFFAAMLMRHPLSLVIGARTGARAGAARGPAAAGRATLAAWVLWTLLGGGGALLVAMAIRADAFAFKWAREVAQVTVLAGLPSLSLATTCALVTRRAVAFWLVTPLLLALFALFSFGLRGELIPPVFPGVIELGLMSGREALRARATLGALAWPVLGLLIAGAAGLRDATQRKAVRSTARMLTERQP